MDVVHGVASFLFKCRRCGGYFCENHRLPEQHDCLGYILDDVRHTIKISMKDDHAFMIKKEMSDLEKKNRLPLYNDIYLTDNEHDKKLDENSINPRKKKTLPLYNDSYRPNISPNGVKKSVPSAKKFSSYSKSFLSKFGKSLALLCIAAIVLFVAYSFIGTDHITNLIKNGTDSITENPTKDVTPTQLIKASGEPIELIDNKYATNPTWNELISFMKLDDTDRILYEDDNFTCGDFAERLHNNAENAGIKAAVVSIDFYENSNGHALNIFDTVDKGLVYVDCTGSEGKIGELDSFDKIAYVETDNEYGIVSAYYTTTPEYEFYNARKNKNLKGFYKSPGIVKDVKIYWDQYSLSNDVNKYPIVDKITKNNEVGISNDHVTNDSVNGTSYYVGNDYVYYAGADNHRIYLQNNQDAKNPTYPQLMSFLKNDDTDRIIYDENSFVCADFAENLHNNAEDTEMRCAYVIIDFEDGYGHAINAFQTTDRGLIYIDCTGNTEKIGPWESDSFDKIGYLEIGKEYGAVSIYETDDFRYWYWETYKDRGRKGYYYPSGIVKNIEVYW